MSLQFVKQQLSNLARFQASPEAAPNDKKGKKLKASAGVEKRKKDNKKRKESSQKKDKKTAVPEVELTDEQVIKRNIAYFKRTAASTKSSTLMVQVKISLLFRHVFVRQEQCLDALVIGDLGLIWGPTSF